MRWLWAVLIGAGVFWMWAWLSALTGVAAQEFESPSFVYTLQKHETFDFRDIQFFELKSLNGSATIAVDGDVDLAKVLKQFSGQRVRITFEPVTRTFQKIER